MLIRNADLPGSGRRDVRLGAGRIAAIAPALDPLAGETVIDADGAALLPGLHDHHLHLAALAAALASVACGPPQVQDAESLAAALRRASAEGEGWLRGIGYHESVAGDIDRHWLDRQVPARPLRVQHRSGQLWILNSAALQALTADGADIPAACRDGLRNGRLFRCDDWLRARLPGRFPDLSGVSRLLAQRGVTAVTDASVNNDRAQAQRFAAAQARGELRQALLLMGSADLDTWTGDQSCRRGATKFHLNETVLPDFDALCAAIRRSHDAGRAVAAHCVTRTELLFMLAALEAAGAQPGDRIEHASVTPPEAMAQIAALGLTVVTQPNFLWERGDAYRRDVAPEDQPWLYRGRGFRDRGIALAAGSDAPFGAADPWRAMQAAVDRRTRDGATLGAAEALMPEEAVALYTGDIDTPGVSRRLAVGGGADLCLLDRPWSQARSDLSAVTVRLTLRGGDVLWQSPSHA
jgi:predicted amidohydrolase YtcJ